MSPVMAVAYWILKSRSGCRVRKMENAPSGIQRGMGKKEQLEKAAAGMPMPPASDLRKIADGTC